MKLRILAGVMILGMLTLIWWPRLGFPGSDRPQLWKDALHAPFFAVFTLLLFALTPPRRPIRTRLLLTVVLALSFAAITEAVQPFFNRTASFQDLFANSIGILVAISGLWLYRLRKAGLLAKGIHGIVSAVCMLSLFLPAILPRMARDWLGECLPDLSDFGDRRARYFWVSQGNAEIQTRPGPTPALEVLTRAGGWSGVSFFPGAQDWSAYSTLIIEFEIPGDPFELGIRIDDNGDCSQSGSRFSEALALTTGASVHRIPLERIATSPKNRRMNLSAVTRLALFMRPDDPPRVFFLERAFLE